MNKLRNKLRFELENFMRFSREFGFNISFFLKIRLLRHKIISFKPPKLQQPLYFRCRTSDFFAFDQIFVYKQYDLKINYEPRTIIDCGANAGYATVYFKNRYPDARIICVEPDNDNFNLLIRNTEKYNNIIPLQTALWNKSTYLTVVNPNADKWSFMVKEVSSKIESSFKSISLNEIIETYGIEEIDILKIDIEGAEKELFSSNYEPWLSRVKLIIIELHDDYKEGCSKSFFDAMAKYDYRMEISGENTCCFMKSFEK